MGCLLTSDTSFILWKDVIQLAEDRCSIELEDDLESYLISLLMRYTNKPEVAQQIFATSFLEAQQARENLRHLSLQNVGDGCLLYAGLFPRASAKKNVKISYFVDLGRAAYEAISNSANDFYHSLALEFVVLMDVLQSIQQYPDLLPLEAYEQWNEVGSQRALRILRECTGGFPFKTK